MINHNMFRITGIEYFLTTERWIIFTALKVDWEEEKSEHRKSKVTNHHKSWSYPVRKIIGLCCPFGCMSCDPVILQGEETCKDESQVFA